MISALIFATRKYNIKKKHAFRHSGSIMKHLKEFVKSVPDYRRTDKGNYKHKLEDILLLVILGRLGKCITRPDIIRFGERNLKRFRSLGILLEGVPSEPTLCRVFKHIDDEAMSERMSEFTAAFHAVMKPCLNGCLNLLPLSMLNLSVLPGTSSVLTARR